MRNYNLGKFILAERLDHVNKLADRIQEIAEEEFVESEQALDKLMQYEQVLAADTVTVEQAGEISNLLIKRYHKSLQAFAHHHDGNHLPDVSSTILLGTLLDLQHCVLAMDELAMITDRMFEE